MSASEFRIPYQQVSSSQPAENVTQFKICRCGEGDTSENGDSPPTSCPSCQNVPPPRGAEPIVTLGGIDLNSSGRPAEFALVDADGSPSFLEKALKFIEDHGKIEFSPEEDAHVIGDCIKYVLREMPSSPVPASCCSALVKAYRSCSSEAYTESEDDDVDKEYSTDNDIHDDDGSYDSGEDDIEGLDDNSETYSDGSEHDSKINANVKARKDLSSEEIEFSGDDETLIDKLEHNKIDLQSKIAKEAKENAILHASLERRKEELRERYLALEKEVENLRDQLHKERNLRSSLESGVMNLRRGQTKADLEEVATAESDNMNLKQKASDLRGQVIGQQMCCESCNKRLLNTDRTGGPESVEASSVVGSDSASDMGDVEQSRTHPPSTDKTGQEAVGSITRRAPQRMQSVARESQDGSSSTSKWNLAQRQYSNSPLLREPGGSAVPAASFALAKLTNRLNFLKERRAQLASEMQSLDLGRPPAAAAAAGAPLVKSPTPKGPEKRRS
nr:unnamed protein product [Digitaria exilis]